MKYIFLALCPLITPILASSPPTCEAVGDENKVQHISLSGDTTCATFKNGKVKCWGGNMYGQLGLDDTVERGSGPNQMGDSLPFVTFKDSEPVSQMSLGADFTCAKFENGKVRCWGYNLLGQLATGDRVNRGPYPGDMSSLDYIDLGSSVTVEKIVTGQTHTCALLDDGTVKCWGDNSQGSLGLGTGIGDIITFPYGLGDNLLTANLGSKKVIDIVAGEADFNMVRFEDGSIKAWGENRYGQLGIGADDNAIGDEPGEMGVNLNEIDLGFSTMTGDPKIENMCTGGFHSCVLYTREVNQVKSSHVKCWGNNQDGQLGLGDTAPRGKNLNEMGANLPEVDLGQEANPVEVHCGTWHTCALFDNGQVKCWGQGVFGAVGLLDIQNRGDEPGEMGDNLPFLTLRVGYDNYALQLAAGGSNTCVVLDNYQVKCWGANHRGQLGLGDSRVRTFPSLALNIGCFDDFCTTPACGHFDCFNPGCPDFSMCSVPDAGTISCTCYQTHVNSDWPERDTDVDPDGSCTPKFLADYELVSPETIQISITNLYPRELMYIGLEVHKLTSEVDKEIVSGFQDQRITLLPNTSPVTKEFSGFEPGFKYEITLFPLSLKVQPIGTVREGVYHQTLVVGNSCRCSQESSDSQRSNAVAHQQEGFVMFSFPDVSNCEDQYELTRKTESVNNTYVSTLDVENGVCSETFIEPGMQLVDDLRSSNLIVGKTYAYDISPISRNTGLPVLEQISVQHTVQWEASILGNVIIAETDEPAVGVAIAYQLRSHENEVILECSGSDGDPTDEWCQTVTSSDGTFKVPFKLNHQSLTNDQEAAFIVRLGDGLSSDDCNNLENGCESGAKFTVQLNHLSFNVHVGLLFAENGNSPTTSVAIGSSIAGGVILVAATAVFGLK